MAETDEHLTEANPEAPVERPRRAHTVFGRLAHALREQNWVAVAIEVLVVVGGVFVGMQVNNWNERRKLDERFRFGLRELHADIEVASFLAGALADKTRYHLVVIDSLLQHPDDVAPERVPALFWILDHCGGNRVWEVEHTLADGEVKFRTDPEWTLDWGRGELSPERLTYKGADIPVEAGRDRIRIDVRESTVRFTPVGP